MGAMLLHVDVQSKTAAIFLFSYVNTFFCSTVALQGNSNKGTQGNLDCP